MEVAMDRSRGLESCYRVGYKVALFKRYLFICRISQDT